MALPTAAAVRSACIGPLARVVYADTTAHVHVEGCGTAAAGLAHHEPALRQFLDLVDIAGRHAVSSLCCVTVTTCRGTREPTLLR
jgi:phage tail protein X